MKAVHRLMMTSSVYRQSSAVTPAHEKSSIPTIVCCRACRCTGSKPRNCDTLLLVAGRLDEKRFGPADAVQVLPDGIVQSGQRRSVYVQQLRKHPPTLLECFDLPAMNPNCLSRSDSLVALQALHLLNDTTVRELAGHLAGAYRSPPEMRRPTRCGNSMIAFSRPPTTEESSLSLRAGRLTETWHAS